MNKIKVLELFAGSRSVGKAANELGMEVFSVDKFITENMDIVSGVESLTKELVISSFGVPNIVWASPVCSAWSKVGWFNHWDTDIYRITKHFLHSSDFALESIEMVRKTIEIFSWFKEAVFFMENPDGMLQFHPVIRYFDVYELQIRKHLLTYCRYGDNVRKPTNIWSNSKNWQPKPICNNGDKCHIRSPRCTPTGTLSKKDSYERSKIPHSLCIEILQSAALQIGGSEQKINYQQTNLFAA